MGKAWVCQTDKTHIFAECSEDGFCPFDPPYHGILLLESTAELIVKDNDKNLVEKSYHAKLNEPVKPKVFISYGHKDRIYFEIFKENFESHSMWDIWTDRNIEIGSDWYDRIRNRLKTLMWLSY